MELSFDRTSRRDIETSWMMCDDRRTHHFPRDLMTRTNLPLLPVFSLLSPFQRHASFSILSCDFETKPEGKEKKNTNFSPVLPVSKDCFVKSGIVHGMFTGSTCCRSVRMLHELIHQTRA